MLAQTARLAMALALLWCVLAAPAYWLAGGAAIVGLSAAVLLCFVPGLVVIGLQAGPIGQSQPLAGLLVSMGLRMVFVVAAVLVAREVWPELSPAVFLMWVVPTYLVALAVETRFALADDGSQSGVSGSRQVPASGP